MMQTFRGYLIMRQTFTNLIKIEYTIEDEMHSMYYALNLFYLLSLETLPHCKCIYARVIISYKSLQFM